MQRLVRMVGMVTIATGLLWIGQGLGLINWPRSSFMIDQRIWALWGTLMALLGVGLIAVSRRL